MKLKKNDIKLIIESIFEITDRGVFIGVKLIEGEANFSINSFSKIDDIKLDEFLDIPRKLDKNGNQLLDFFILKLANKSDKTRINKGQIVSLNNLQ